MNFRDEHPVLGPRASVEILNGAGAPTLVRVPVGQTASLTLQTAPTTGTKYCVFIAPPAAAGSLPMLGSSWKVLSVTAVWGVASSSGTIDVQKVASGTADASGTTILTGTIDGSATAATPVAGALVTNNSTLTLANADRLQVVFGGTTTSWVDVHVSILIGRTV